MNTRILIPLQWTPNIQYDTHIHSGIMCIFRDERTANTSNRQSCQRATECKAEGAEALFSVFTPNALFFWLCILQFLAWDSARDVNHVSENLHCSVMWRCCKRKSTKDLSNFLIWNWILRWRFCTDIISTLISLLRKIGFIF